MSWKFPLSKFFFSFSEQFCTFLLDCFIVCAGSHQPPLSTRRHREMKLGLVIQTAVALHLLLSPAQSLPVASITNTTEVLMFQEVWGRSFCRTIEKLVEVVQEYPTEVEHIYSPACVPLVRCAGCCGDENLECHPTQTTNVTMQLLKIRPSEPGKEYVEMTFVEHQTCECRVRKPVAKVERKRQRGKGRKRKDRQKPKECDRCQNPRR
ncbi:placenta growth factor isoform X2 [Epinephelus fuscoguttatus]|uniref:placenta growth factor isoform X2 n=1 Tax=Epinephelus fuscoguttatus TaxID=293821 RepID=UPI0020D0E177|nr:placenta growth factor isoform X2 [Epinephelus fuscoguttatus]